jgi:4-hydroxy-4-methyl-2-oxoglutarate aldolase
MIGEPVALKVRRSIERPSPALMRAVEGAPTGFVTDAYNGKGCMDWSIKPLSPEMYVCGTAITAQCSGGDLLAVMAALDYAQQGDVIVITAGSDTSAAKLGDLWLYWAKRIGVAGVVCDGLVRDVKGLLAVGLPVFARGACPNGAYKTGPGEINLGVSCGGVPVQPGDIIVGDRDGVVAVPRTAAEQVVAQLELVKQKEADAEGKVKRGEKLKFWDEAALAARGAIRYVD